MVVLVHLPQGTILQHHGDLVLIFAFSSVATARLVNISPIPDIRRDSVAVSDDPELLTLPVPPDFADSRRSSRIQQW